MSDFYRWLLQQNHRRDPVGLIARLVVHDQFFPREQNQLHSLLTYYDTFRKDPIHSQLFLSPIHRNLIKRAHREWRRAVARPCILDCDSPSYPPDRAERMQCGCDQCMKDLK